MFTSADKFRIVFICVLLATSALLVYWQVHKFDFVAYDDNSYIYENNHVVGGLTFEGVKAAFTTAPAGGNWLPLTWLSFMLDCEVFGLNPGRMHLVNVLLHLANTLLLFLVLSAMTKSLWPSAFVAAAFALHPMHVESVAWVTERKDVLSSFFMLLTLAAYLNYTRRGGSGRYLLAFGLFTAGLLAKPMLVTVPFLLLLLDYWPLGRIKAGTAAVKSGGHSSGENTIYRLVLEKMPFLAMSVASSIATFIAQHVGGSVIGTDIWPFRLRVANAFLSYAKYVGKMFWPQNLGVLYPLDRRDLVLWQIASSVILLVIVSVLVIWLGRRWKYLPVGWLWFIVTLVPVVGLVQSGVQAMADRYTYIPYTGLFIIIA